MNKDVEGKLLMLCASLGVTLTDEQMEFASNFSVPTLSLSDPGSGKTFATLIGIRFLQDFYGVPGYKINAMSFTRKATQEFSVKYTNLCKKLRKSPSVNFNTFHSLCNDILKESWGDFKISQTFSTYTDLEYLQAYANKEGITDCTFSYLKRLLSTIDNLNAALIFDDDHILGNHRFKKLNMELDTFKNIRTAWFLGCRYRKQIAVGDIPIHALFNLLTTDGLSEKYKAKYEVMIVDEFQDLSLLHLKVLSLISRNLVAIGDIKQQIYGFNGASDSIIKEFYKMYPEAREVKLTHSFRCATNIAEYATRCIRPNFGNIESFVGNKEGGDINVHAMEDISLDDLIDDIKEREEAIRSSDNPDTSMFLVRNNDSALYIIDKLYSKGVMTRCSKFVRIDQVPMFDDLCALVNAGLNDKDTDIVYKALRVFPEYKFVAKDKNPIIQLIRKHGVGLLDDRVGLGDAVSKALIVSIKHAVDLVKDEQPANIVLGAVWKAWNKYVYNEKNWIKDMSVDYYSNLVSPMLRDRTYTEMITREFEKEANIEECNKLGIGLRVYTIHSAKGLEADHIYLVDAENRLFPSYSSMSDLIDSDSLIDAGLTLRNERNLLYVAISRAKTEVNIYYTDELTSLLSSPDFNAYTFLDKVYEESNIEYDDVTAFLKTIVKK